MTAAGLALVFVAAACGSDDNNSSNSTEAPATTAGSAETTAGSTATTTASSDSGTGGGSAFGGFDLACSDTPPAPGSTPAKVKLQLQWVTQAQFAGYFAAVAHDFYKKQGLDVQILEGGVDIVPQTQLANGAADFAIAWVPKALQSREQGAGITDISQVFQRSGTLQVSWKDSAITSAADLKGKKVGNWGFGNEFELFAGMTKAGLDPGKDVSLVQQQFDMQALLNKEIDAAQAMTYNEYAQVLEAKNPATGKLYTPDDFNTINWNDEGTAMLQDAIWANTDKLKTDQAYCDTAVRFVAGSLQGWAYCRDHPDDCVNDVLNNGSKLGKSHQAWQMNEINKLIWPSPSDGVGTIEQNAWDQTVKISRETKNADGSTVITKAPDAESATNDINAKAIALLKSQNVDVVGDGFTPATVTLNEGGA
jgi:NitT/TauT family transport system substrate-binding protein